MSIVVTKSTIKPQRNKISAIRSNFVEFRLLLLIERNENKQLLIKIIIASAAPSSIKDDSSSLETLTEVKTMKQNPNKLADVFKIWGDLFSLSSFIQNSIINYSASSNLIFLVIL